MAWDHVLHNRKISDIVEIVCSRFESEDTDEGKEFSIGGAAIREVISLVSNDAYEKIASMETPRRKRIGSDGCCYRTDEYGGKYGLVFEHVVPNKVVRELLDAHWKSCKASGKMMDRDLVKKIIEKLQVALITAEENKLLNAVHKDTMPDKNWLDKGDVLGRYRAAFGKSFDKMWHKFR